MISRLLSDVKLPPAKTVVSSAASLAASAMVIRSIASDLLPSGLRQYAYLSIQDFFRSLSSEVVLIIEEFSGLGTNQVFRAADTYLGIRLSPNTKSFRVSMPEKESKISTSVGKNEEMIDQFNGVQLRWRLITRIMERRRHSSEGQTEIRYFDLRFHGKHKKMVLEVYLPFIVQESKNANEEKKTLKIHTLRSGRISRYSSSPGDDTWASIKLDHPATFDTLAMDSEVKKMIINDLDRFVRRRDYYKKVGKAWKRGYLLYGPPGTGKSSLVAAMANHLNFDIYDMELTDIHANSDLKRVLLSTGNRSILVVEDIDCSCELDDRKDEERALKFLRSGQASQVHTVNIAREKKPDRVTLSGLLNFIDGLWSSCGDERIIVFTTNHKERIDPALLRPGRMDMHIHMSYCNPCAFRTLAANYLGFTEHSLFPEIDELLTAANATPAEVGEQLLRSEETEEALRGLIEFLHQKKQEAEAIKAKELEEEAAKANKEGDATGDAIQQGGQES